METITMSCQQDSGSAAWSHCSKDLGGGGGGGGGAEDILGLFGGPHTSSDDLFELVWRGSGGGMQEEQPCNPLSSSRPVAAAVPVPESLSPPPPAPPSEAEMASWLFPIVSGGEKLAGGGDAVVVVVGRRDCVDDDQMVPPSPSRKESSDRKLEKRKTSSSTGGRRRSHHHSAQAHSLTEKRRRCKINEKLKTLQQLVPGCNDNSNQASTLDQTIRYMKSLQQHIQAMSSFRCGMKPTSVAVYPVVQQAPSNPPCWWQGGTSVQGWLLDGPQVPFCAHVSMGSPSPPCSHMMFSQRGEMDLRRQCKCLSGHEWINH